jgi:hypothetical protein
METWALLTARRVMYGATMLLLSALLAASMTAVAADPAEEVDGKPPAAGKNAEEGAARLKIEVVAKTPGKEPSTEPLKNAMVKVVGEDNWYKTDNTGKTKRFASVAGAQELLVRPPGTTGCTLKVLLKKGSQDLTVLVQTGPELTCSLKPSP